MCAVPQRSTASPLPLRPIAGCRETAAASATSSGIAFRPVRSALRRRLPPRARCASYHRARQSGVYPVAERGYKPVRAARGRPHI